MDDRKLDCGVLLRWSVYGVHFRRSILHAEPTQIRVTADPNDMELFASSIQYHGRVSDAPGVHSCVTELRDLSLYLCAKFHRTRQSVRLLDVDVRVIEAA